MKPTLLASGILISAMVSWNAHAQTVEQGDTEEQAELDIIMTIVDENDTPDAVFQRIELPPATASVPDIQLPQVEVVEELEAINQAVDNLTEDTADTVTETINDALSSGNIDDLPGDIKETISEDVLDDLVDDRSEAIDEAIDDLDDSLDSTESVDEAIDQLDGSLKGVEDATEMEQMIELDEAMETIGGVEGL